jgi:hypothetical protein
MVMKRWFQAFIAANLVSSVALAFVCPDTMPPPGALINGSFQPYH